MFARWIVRHNYQVMNPCVPHVYSGWCLRATKHRTSIASESGEIVVHLEARNVIGTQKMMPHSLRRLQQMHQFFARTFLSTRSAQVPVQGCWLRGQPPRFTPACGSREAGPPSTLLVGATGSARRVAAKARAAETASSEDQRATKALVGPECCRDRPSPTSSEQAHEACCFEARAHPRI